MCSHELTFVPALKTVIAVVVRDMALPSGLRLKYLRKKDKENCG